MSNQVHELQQIYVPFGGATDARNGVHRLQNGRFVGTLKR
jgi:hypothetical protein